MKLKGQHKLVYECLRDHGPITVRGMNALIPVDKVSARLSEMERIGIKIKRHGRNKSREMLYSLEKQETKLVQRHEFTDKGVRLWYEEVEV